MERDLLKLRGMKNLTALAKDQNLRWSDDPTHQGPVKQTSNTKPVIKAVSLTTSSTTPEHTKAVSGIANAEPTPAITVIANPDAGKPAKSKADQLLNKGFAADQMGSYKAAIKDYDKAFGVWRDAAIKMLTPRFQAEKFDPKNLAGADPQVFAQLARDGYLDAFPAAKAELLKFFNRYGLAVKHGAMDPKVEMPNSERIDLLQGAGLMAATAVTIEPNYGRAHYNLACISLRMFELDGATYPEGKAMAFDHLRRAIADGRVDFKKQAKENDTDWNGVRNDAEFREIVGLPALPPSQAAKDRAAVAIQALDKRTDEAIDGIAAGAQFIPNTKLAEMTAEVMATANVYMNAGIDPDALASNGFNDPANQQKLRALRTQTDDFNRFALLVLSGTTNALDSSLGDGVDVAAWKEATRAQTKLMADTIMNPEDSGEPVAGVFGMMMLPDETLFAVTSASRNPPPTRGTALVHLGELSDQAVDRIAPNGAVDDAAIEALVKRLEIPMQWIDASTLSLGALATLDNPIADTSSRSQLGLFRSALSDQHRIDIELSRAIEAAGGGPGKSVPADDVKAQLRKSHREMAEALANPNATTIKDTGGVLFRAAMHLPSDVLLTTGIDLSANP